jgi:hypothetical protein
VFILAFSLFMSLASWTVPSVSSGTMTSLALMAEGPGSSVMFWETRVSEQEHQ